MASHLSLAENIMMEFARNTGLFPTASLPRRYLWTDAFAVCNFLGLYRERTDKDFRDLALQLVEQVHTILGRHRRDDLRTGSISGLNDGEAKHHPTAGGLRIGKGLKERGPGELLDERLEWDRDGQYFHYLTKWMHALNLVTKAMGNFTYNRWAIELARTAHDRFVYTPFPGAQKRIYWKMSIDLSYPLVTSMGLHDPLDGLITYTQLMATASKDAGQPVNLETEIADMANMCNGMRWVTSDLLGIGGLLCDAFRVAQLMTSGYLLESQLLLRLLDDSLVGLKALDRENLLGLAADFRLAFRELGLSIGLRALEKLAGLIGQLDVSSREIARLKSHVATLPGNRSETWIDHQDINMVMLAASLSPVGYLTLGNFGDD